MVPLTQILEAAGRGDAQAAEKLAPLVYDELCRLAQRQLAKEAPGQTLEPSALVHEAYLRLVGDQQFDNRRHFFAAAAEAMRRILIENARRKSGPRQGGGRQRVPFVEEQFATDQSTDVLLDLDDALNRLATEDGEAAAVAQLRIFAGLSVEEAATALGQSRATAYRHWTYARAWLRETLQSK